MRDATPTCQVCGEVASAASDRACARCAAPHHLDCWEFSGGCSIYGCGELRSVALGSVPDGSLSGEITLDEASHVPVLRGPAARAIGRRLRAHAGSLPVTLAYGLGGPLLGCTALAWLHGTGGLGYTFAIMLGSGLVFGLLAPFVAPLMHRRPGRAGLLAFALHAASFHLLDVMGHELAGLEPALFVFSVVTWMFAASALSDAFLGPRTGAGQRLGRAGGVVRLLATWVLALVVFCTVPIAMGKGVPPLEAWSGLATLAGMVALVAAPALEKGKQEYRRLLLPGRAD